jgi:hypothetical protein
MRRKRGNIFTAENSVQERTGVPFLSMAVEG